MILQICKRPKGIRFLDERANRAICSYLGMKEKLSCVLLIPNDNDQTLWPIYRHFAHRSQAKNLGRVR